MSFSVEIQRAIAVDGPAGAGKSSITKEVARKLNLVYIDSGAFYRTVAYFTLKLFPMGKIELPILLKNLDQLNLEYAPSPEVLVRANAVDLTSSIRSNEVAMMASTVSAIPEIRLWVNDRLRAVAASAKNICIMEGRDIGTVIFPHALVKIFIMASPQIRAKRRYDELSAINKLGNLTLAQILSDIISRDFADSNRKIAPLIPASDAIVVDTSDLSFDQVLKRVIELISSALNSIK